MDKFDIGLRKHKFIIFSEDHYNPLGVVRSLGEEGIKTIAITIGSKPCLINNSRYVEKIHIVSSREEGYKLLLQEYGNESVKPFVFTSDDKTTCYLDRHYNEIIDKFYFYNAGEQGRIEWLQNKDNITNLGSNAGLEIPRKEVVKTGTLPRTLNYPIITKVLASTMGAWKGDVHICKNENDLLQAYKSIEAPQLILQEYIQKKGEFCMEGVSVDNGKQIYMPFLFDYIRYYDNSYGYYMDVIPFNDPDLLRKIQALFCETKFNGVFEIEFMKGPNGENYFLEINLRASTWNYAPTIGGCNLPYLWAKSTIAGRLMLEENAIEKLPFKAMVEPYDIGNVKSGKVGLITWLKELHACKCTYFYNKRDKKPALFYWMRRIFKNGK